MLKIYSSFLILMQIIIAVVSVDPPIWPTAFSQSFSAYLGDSNTTGKFWYDFDAKGQRYDFANGISKHACSSMTQQNTPCSYLMTQNQFYMILPQKQFCSFVAHVPIFQRNWLQNYTFVGQQQINHQYFYVWQQPPTEEKVQYFAWKDAIFTPKRFTTGQNFTLDFWKQSYSQNPISSIVFTIPSYCQKKSNTQNQSKSLNQLKKQ